MPYIGKSPVGGGFHKLDNLTASATATYALTLGGAAYYPETANQLLVSLNGVIQAPQDSFTVSGSNLVFDSALTASDSIDFVVALGDVLGVQGVTDGTVTAAKIANNAVTSAKLDTNIDIAGTLDVTGALTADSGLYLGGTGSTHHLDDYEEGTWTPTLALATTTTYTSQIGTYTKVGSLVQVYFDLAISSVGNGSPSTVTGLPFPALNNDALAVSYFQTLAVSPYSLQFQLGSTNALAVGVTSAGATISNGLLIFGNGSRVIASGCYRTSA